MSFTLPIPVDTALILDDGCVSPSLVLVDPITGVFRGYTDAFSCGSEAGYVMPDGTICTGDTSGPNGGVKIFNKDLTQLAYIDITGSSDSVTGVASDDKDFFYLIIKQHAAPNALTLYKIDKTTAAVLDSFATGYNLSNEPAGFDVTKDKTFAYLVTTLGTPTLGVAPIVTKINLNTHAAVDYNLVNGYLAITLHVDAAGFVYVNVGTDPFSGTYLQKYDSNLNFISQIQTNPATYRTNVSAWNHDRKHITVWTQTNVGAGVPDNLSAFVKVKTSDLTIVNTRTGIITDIVTGTHPVGTAISNSCPLLLSGGISAVSEDDCGGGALTQGGDPGHGTDGCISGTPCTDTTLPADLPSFFSSILTANGAPPCWNAGTVIAILPDMAANTPPYFPQVNSAGVPRAGRFYKDSPTNYEQYVDTNRGCSWAWITHGF